MTWMLTRRRLTFALMALLTTLAPLWSGEVSAQTVTGSMVGTVLDESGAALPGVSVVATDTERGTTRVGVTNAQGQYTLSSLESGTYRVVIELTGFKKFVRERVDVAINTTVRLDAKLGMGTVSEVVEVSGERPNLQTERSDVNRQITPVQLENLPLSPDRNYQSLMELAPGVTEAAAVGSSFGNPNGSVVNRVNGQNERANSFQLDGTMNNQTNVISQTNIVPPPEAIEIVDISTNAYDAEHGRSTGGITNVQIKSGTNNLKGSVFAHLTDSAFKARNALQGASGVPDTKLSQVGFTLGGPIRKNKTFFFVDYQNGRNRRGQNDLLSVPSAAFRRGDFSGTTTPIHDPATGAAGVRTQFPGNVIPADRISPISLAILARLPLPTRAGETSNYDAAGQFVQDRNSFDIKVNHTIGNRTQGFVRYSFFKANTEDPPVFGALGGPTSSGGATAAIGGSQNQSATLNLTHTFSSSLVSEFRIGWVRVAIDGTSPTEADLSTRVGIPGINTGDFFTGGLARIVISGYESLGIVPTVPFKINENSFNVVNNWTKLFGKHSLRFGTDLRRLSLDKYQSAAGDPRGQFTFATGPTSRTAVPTSSANAFAAFLLGLPTAIERTAINQLSGYSIPQYFFFVQDRWQASPKLTVNVGLRYEIQPFASVPNPGDQSRYLPDTNQILVAGYGSTDSRLNVKTDFSNFAPRLGIAYRLDPKTVLRTGYGKGFIPLGMNQLAGVGYPAQVRVSIQGANNTLPAGNIANGIPNVPVVDVSSGVVNSPPGNVVQPVVNPDSRRGYVHSFNFTIQRDLSGFVVDASYVGSLGRRLPGTINLNAAGPGATTASRPLAILFGRTADTLLSDWVLRSSYHALQMSVERRLRQGRLTLAYTLSKSKDHSNAFTLENPLDLESNFGPSSFDRRHNLVFSHVLRLPFGKGRRFMQDGLGAAILGGWRASGVLSIRSGSPVNITGVRLAANATQGVTNRPDQTGEVRIIGGTGPGQFWFDTNAFTEPLAGTLGNAGRNSVRGPGYANYNLTLSRSFSFSKDKRVELSAAAFNLTNTPHYSNPSGAFTSGNFGQISNTFGEREIRFGARLLF